MSDQSNSASEASTIRFSELGLGQNGRLQTRWVLTDIKKIDTVKLVIPPTHALPIVFIPGIMGSNLCNDKNLPVWLLNSVGDIPHALVATWTGKGAGYRQVRLHPDKTRVYKRGAVPGNNKTSGIGTEEYIKRGWGEVSQASYHKFLLWLDQKMNSQRNPLNWIDFSNSSLSTYFDGDGKKHAKLPAGLVMLMAGLPKLAENGFPIDPIMSDELLKRSIFSYPIYAFGYNWLRSNDENGRLLSERIKEIILENNKGHVACQQVIVVTHSMGGLVARACAALPEMPEKIVGIVHGVMPAVGAAVAYRRCKVGMADEDYVAGLVIGSDGREVSAVFAQAPGALQLLPSAEYGKEWLKIEDPVTGNIQALPQSDPYEEIYLEKNKWWGLIKEDWLNPPDGEPIDWSECVLNVTKAKEFHRKISGVFHPKTFVFYGGGSESNSFSKIKWTIKKGSAPQGGFGISPRVEDIPKLHHNAVRTDGSNNLYVGGERLIRTTTRGDSLSFIDKETSFWEISCAFHDSSGDGTVPSSSGGFPRGVGGKKILQQFELPGVSHEPAYRDFPVAKQVTYYSITKLSALAKI